MVCFFGVIKKSYCQYCAVSTCLHTVYVFQSFPSCFSVRQLVRCQRHVIPSSKLLASEMNVSYSSRVRYRLPEYFPPLFLFTKQAMSTMSVRRAMAHISPMNQPWVEIPPWTLARPAEGGRKGGRIKKNKTKQNTPVTLTRLGLFIGTLD